VRRSGSTVPVKWRLPDGNGSFVRELTAVTSIDARVVGCDLLSVASEVMEGEATGETSLRYDLSADHYVFNWDTSSRAPESCHVLNVALDDGTTRGVYFRLK
jgi:hypothetical protein